MIPDSVVSLPQHQPIDTVVRTVIADDERLARQKISSKVSYQVEIMMGDPGAEIIQASKRLHTNLIVMATHGRKGLRHLILGSVAEQVIREAPCPVLAVKPKVPAAKIINKPAIEKTRVR